MIWRIVIEAMLLRATAASVLTNAPFTLCKPMLHAVINTYTGRTKILDPWGNLIFFKNYLKISYKSVHTNYGGLVVGRRTCDLAGSRPGRDAAAQQP